MKPEFWYIEYSFCKQVKYFLIFFEVYLYNFNWTKIPLELYFIFELKCERINANIIAIQIRRQKNLYQLVTKSHLFHIHIYTNVYMCNVKQYVYVEERVHRSHLFFHILHSYIFIIHYTVFVYVFFFYSPVIQYSKASTLACAP